MHLFLWKSLMMRVHEWTDQITERWTHLFHYFKISLSLEQLQSVVTITTVNKNVLLFDMVFVKVSDLKMTRLFGESSAFNILWWFLPSLELFKLIFCCLVLGFQKSHFWKRLHTCRKKVFCLFLCICRNSMPNPLLILSLILSAFRKSLYY